jgi:hypothetical protein
LKHKKYGDDAIAAPISIRPCSGLLVLSGTSFLLIAAPSNGPGGVTRGFRPLSLLLQGFPSGGQILASLEWSIEAFCKVTSAPAQRQGADRGFLPDRDFSQVERYPVLRFPRSDSAHLSGKPAHEIGYHAVTT